MRNVLKSHSVRKAENHGFKGISRVLFSCLLLILITEQAELSTVRKKELL